MTEAIEKALREIYPESTEAECFRFVQAATSFHKKASKMLEKENLVLKTASEKLGEYLRWRSLHEIDHDRPAQDSDDKSVWDWAVRKAMDTEKSRKSDAEGIKTGTRGSNSSTKKRSKLAQEQSIERRKNQANTEKKQASQSIVKERQLTRTLPQLIFKRSDPKTGEFVRDKNGTELIHVLPARIDRFAADSETWALAVTLYIDACVDRNSRYKASIMVDARAGQGWANPVLIMVVSMIGQIVTELDKRHPGRCKSLIIFPLPRALTLVWKGIKKLFSPEINELLVVCSGPSDLGSPLPRKKLEAYVDGETLDYLEKCRRQLFVEDKL